MFDAEYGRNVVLPPIFNMRAHFRPPLGKGTGSQEDEEFRFPRLPHSYRQACEKKTLGLSNSKPRVRKTMSVDMASLPTNVTKEEEAPGEEQTCPITLRSLVPSSHPNQKHDNSTVFEPSPPPRSVLACLCCWSALAAN